MNKRERIIIIVAVLIAAIGIGAVIAATTNKNNSPQPQVTVSPSLTPTSSISPAVAPAADGSTGTSQSTGQIAQAGNGVIEGPIVYPSEAIPPELQVCAVNLGSNATTCTGQHINSSRFKGNTGYQLSVPAGNYQVYAVVGSNKGYYSKMVTCGYNYGCADHSPITVAVAAGQTVPNIEPGDFYAR